MEDHQRRSILQFLMLERILSNELFLSLVDRVTGSGSKGNSDRILNAINLDIGEFSQKLIKSTCEATGERVVALVSTADQADIKSSLSKDHLDYVYHVIDLIVTSGGALDFISALNLASSVNMSKMSISEAERLLQSLIADKFFVMKDGHLHLSALAIAELGSFITENYEVGSCELCKKIVVFGDKCQKCEAPFHVHCLKDFVNSHKKSKCPQCHQDLL